MGGCAVGADGTHPAHPALSMSTRPIPPTRLSLFALVLRCAIIAALGCAAAVGVNAVRTEGLPLVAGEMPQGLPLPAAAVPCPGVPVAWWGRMQRVEAAEAHSLWQRQGVLFVDARPHADYIFKHISGALELPYRDFTRALEREGARLTPGTRVVIYDSGKPCGEALRVAKQLPGLNVSLLTVGYSAWEQAGYPTTGGHDRGELGWEGKP